MIQQRFFAEYETGGEDAPLVREYFASAERAMARAKEVTVSKIAVPPVAAVGGETRESALWAWAIDPHFRQFKVVHGVPA